MRKILTLFMICVLVIMTGCVGSDNKPPEKNTEKIKLGMITRLNVSETLLNNYFEKASARMNQTSSLRAPEHIFFDNMNSMLAALEAGQVDELSIYKSVAYYLLVRNANFEISSNHVPKVSDSFCCALREEDTALKNEFDEAIKALKSDGTLENLVKIHITDVKDTEPPAVELPHFEGTDTIKIAVTGDLPPLDLITADGKPAGFNTALLAAISQRLGKNFEIVQVDSGARSAALTSKQVDVVFWVTIPLENALVPPDFDKPAGLIVTVPYFSDEIAHIKLNNNK